MNIIVEDLIHAWMPAVGVFTSFIIFCGLFHWLLMCFIRFVTNKLPMEADLNIKKAFDTPARIIILISGLFTAASISPLAPVVEINWVAHLYHSIVVICIYWILYNICTSSNFTFSYLMEKYQWHIDEAIASSISTALHALVICLGTASVLSVWGFDINGFIAGLSIGGLAFSLAAKDSLSNIFAGLIILIDKPFTIGDWIECNNIEGTVENISFRSTCVRTFPQALVYIPNNLISTTAIKNFSKRGKHRLQMTLGVTYSTTKSQMEELVNRIKTYLLNNKEVYSDSVAVTFDNMNSSSLDIRIVCYVRTADFNTYLLFKQEVNLMLMGLLEEIGTSAAYPSTSVYIESLPQGAKILTETVNKTNTTTQNTTEGTTSSGTTTNFSNN